MSEKFKEILQYLFWGVLTTVISWGSFTTASLLSQKSGIHQESTVIILSNTISWVCAVIFSFITNKYFVFQKHNWHFRAFISEFCKFCSSRLATGILELILVPVAVKLGLNQSIFNINGAWAKILVSLSIVVVNYFITKYFVFKDKYK